MKISIVITTYMRPNTIQYCLESVCNQSFSPLEIIVVDDCSDDATISRPLIVWLLEQNQIVNLC
jgi:glycosyltransferase involved in cell wall biosynthesis